MAFEDNPNPKPEYKIPSLLEEVFPPRPTPGIWPDGPPGHSATVVSVGNTCSPHDHLTLEDICTSNGAERHSRPGLNVAMLMPIKQKRSIVHHSST